MTNVSARQEMPRSQFDLANLAQRFDNSDGVVHEANGLSLLDVESIAPC